MTGPAALVWDDRLLEYDFGPGHPLGPVRVELTLALARALGVLDRAGLTIVLPVDAGDALLTSVHTPEYLAAVRAERRDPGRGLGTADDPLFAGMHAAAARVVGATVAAAREIRSGRVLHAVNIAGGLHHAMPGSAAGFCVYNDPAVAIADLLADGVDRVAYVDVDVHHGDGVQTAFRDDPRVLTISLHETGRRLFPGTGFATETGAAGTAVNVALPPGTGDAGWLRAFHAVVPPLLSAFGPRILVSQCGCDTHAADPLAHLRLSVDGQRQAYLAMHDLAHEVCGGRWLATGGGGYGWAQVVPRAWTHLLAIATGDPLAVDIPTPDGWQALVRERTGQDAPRTMTDRADPAFRPWQEDAPVDDPVDEAIAATRAAVFGHHGLTA